MTSLPPLTLGPHLGYRWVRLDLRINAWGALFRNSGSGKSGKTGKPEKLHMTYQIKALGELINLVTLEIRISSFRLINDQIIC